MAGPDQEIAGAVIFTDVIDPNAPDGLRKLGFYDADPNGVIDAAAGSMLLDSATPAVWVNNDGATSWQNLITSGGGSLITQRIQLADLPAALDTGVVPFGAVIPANQIVNGALIYVNADPDPGASGIVSLNATVGVVSANLITTLDLIGVAGAPLYLTAFSNPADVSPGPVASAVAGQPAYQLVAVGANLDQMVAFDITVVIFVSDQVIPVP